MQAVIYRREMTTHRDDDLAEPRMLRTQKSGPASWSALSVKVIESSEGILQRELKVARALRGVHYPVGRSFLVVRVRRKPRRPKITGNIVSGIACNRENGRVEGVDCVETELDRL